MAVGLEWIGHRGAPRIALENTTKSFAAAFDLGANAVELDVHSTADGVPVVHHDAELPADATPIALVGRKIATLTAADIARVELAPTSKIPTLADVLAAVGHRGTVYVEIKGGSEIPVIDVISRSGARCAVHSFDHALIARVGQSTPAMPRGVLCDRSPKDIAALIGATGARDVWPSWRVVDRALVDAVHARGGRVIVWTVNDRATADKMVAMGVDGICSDDLPAVR